MIEENDPLAAHSTHLTHHWLRFTIYNIDRTHRNSQQLRDILFWVFFTSPYSCFFFFLHKYPMHCIFNSTIYPVSFRNSPLLQKPMNNDIMLHRAQKRDFFLMSSHRLLLGLPAVIWTSESVLVTVIYAHTTMFLRWRCIVFSFSCFKNHFSSDRVKLCSLL